MPERTSDEAPRKPDQKPEPGMHKVDEKVQEDAAQERKRNGGYD